MIDNTTPEVCYLNPIVMAGIVDMLGFQIKNLGLATAPGQAVAFEQLTALESDLLALLEAHTADNNQQFQLILNQIQSINGMDEATVQQLIATALSTQYSNETIDQLLLSQGSALIAGLREQVNQLVGRIETLETQVQAGATAITNLQTTVNLHEASIQNLISSDLAQAAQIQELVVANQYLNFTVQNGVVILAEGIAVGDIVRECEVPGSHVNFIFKSKVSNRLKLVFDYIDENGRVIDARVPHGFVPLTEAEIADGYTSRQKVQVSVPVTGTFKVHAD